MFCVKKKAVNRSFLTEWHLEAAGNHLARVQSTFTSLTPACNAAMFFLSGGSFAELQPFPFNHT